MTFPKELGIPSHFVAKLKRCAYGTRDAGAIWEDTYRLALESLGFTSGSASPCCFHHPERNISIVVHGDDFTAMGLQTDLDWYEQNLAKHFELKIRGRLGENVSGPKKLRILNRIITLTDHGIQFEADPRHVDLLASSMGLSQSNSVSTPGIKDPDPDYDLVKNDESKNLPLSAKDALPSSSIDGQITGSAECLWSISKGATDTKKIMFCDSVERFEVPAYSTIYDLHPRFLAATADGWKQTSSHCDPYTSKSGEVMRARCAKFYNLDDRRAAKRYRRELLDELKAQSLIPKSRS